MRPLGGAYQPGGGAHADAAGSPADAAALSNAALARAAAEAGVFPPFAAPLPAGGGSRSPRGAADGLAFQSHAVKFAVRLAEQLEQTSTTKEASPSTEGCYTCLAVLREMMPLLGPLAPVLKNVYDALALCLLSENHYTDGTFMNDPSSPALWAGVGR